MFYRHKRSMAYVAASAEFLKSLHFVLDIFNHIGILCLQIKTCLMFSYLHHNITLHHLLLLLSLPPPLLLLLLLLLLLHISEIIKTHIQHQQNLIGTNKSQCLNNSITSQLRCLVAHGSTTLTVSGSVMNQTVQNHIIYKPGLLAVNLA